MDRTQPSSRFSRLAGLCLISSLTGCVANPIEAPTVWDKLGIPQAAARLRDGTINRSGNFPNLEKKPPVLKLADPKNLQPEKPEMIKAAAKIKQDQDLKKQKIKAIKFLAEVNCGCYNKDDAVAKAFLAALEDCDPDVRKAGIEGLCTAAGNCSKCRNGCETTCCTEEILKKVNDIANGCTDQGCPKEPVKEIRTLAAALLKKCPCPPAKPPEEIPAPEPTEVEEIVAPPEEMRKPETGGEGDRPSNAPEGSSARNQNKFGNAPFRAVSYRVQDQSAEIEQDPVVIASNVARPAAPAVSVANPKELLEATLVGNRKAKGEMEVELPEQYRLTNGWKMLLLNRDGVYVTGSITSIDGKRIVLSVDPLSSIQWTEGQTLHIGRMKD